jgi:protein-S-isoprenylcysteine O-methyltransferase Ste14
MRRTFGILFGVATHLLFAFTVWHLVWFLKGPSIAADTGGGAIEDSRGGQASVAVGLCIDALLAGVFAVPHSVLLLPSVRKRLVATGIAGPFYGCFFCVASCLTLLLVIFCWQPMTTVVWRWPTPLDTWIAWAFVASWGSLLYSLYLTGLGWQTGFTPWWRWVRGQRPPARPFAPQGVYRVMRHPVYLSFLGLVWLVPVVTLDRAVLIGIWTVYIYVGSVLKDRRLLFYVGDEYRRYQADVPGYPGMPFGPLARVPLSSDMPLDAALVTR